ncbi:MAG TPA: hypothetical protein VHA33_02255 [Candidatus Angelobacter sp.]|nr:hypothetical protein [Candidatus Angelobacter sp.]
MSFKKAVRMTPHLQNAWMQGLGALRSQDRPHVAPEDPRRLTGSADVDSALRPNEPNAHRWDFAIGHRHINRKKECVYWVEIHTASDKEVKVVLDKLRWLKTWLAGPGSLLNQFERDFVWVSSGQTSFTIGAPQRKKFALLGLQHKGRVLRIPNMRLS